MTRSIIVLGTALPMLLAATVAHADDDHVSPRERAAIAKVLARQGCQLHGEVERDDGHYEAEHVRCGKRWFEFHLDRHFHVTKREHDDNDDD